MEEALDLSLDRILNDDECVYIASYLSVVPGLIPSGGNVSSFYDRFALAVLSAHLVNDSVFKRRTIGA